MLLVETRIIMQIAMQLRLSLIYLDICFLVDVIILVHLIVLSTIFIYCKMLYFILFNTKNYRFIVCKNCEDYVYPLHSININVYTFFTVYILDFKYVKRIRSVPTFVEIYNIIEYMIILYKPYNILQIYMCYILFKKITNTFIEVNIL